MLFICFALICSISRIIDKRHHWWDVMAGMIIGGLMAILTIKWHLDDFKPTDFEKKYSSSIQNDQDLNSDSRNQDSTDNNIRYRGSTVTIA